MHKADQKFSQWCKEHGFGDIKARVRSAAMWLAGSWSEVTTGLPAEITHPKNIRVWFNENFTADPLPPDLLDPTATTKQKLELEDRAAERYAKTINRGKSGGEGSDIARRHVEALAKKHGVTVGELEEATAAAAHAYLTRHPHQQLTRITHPSKAEGLSLLKACPQDPRLSSTRRTLPQ